MYILVHSTCYSTYSKIVELDNVAMFESQDTAFHKPYVSNAEASYDASDQFGADQSALSVR